MSGASLALTIYAASRLDWRLGYDWRRWILILGHATGLFALSELLWGMREDIVALTARKPAG